MSPRRGPLFRGCLILSAIFVAIAVCLGGVFFYLYRQVVDYTATQPVPVPVKRIRAEEYRKLERRWQDFSDAAERGRPAELVYTADDLNGMIAGSRDPEVRKLAGKVYLRIEDDKVLVDASVSLKGVPLVSERYFNGTVEVTLDVVEGRLRPRILDARTADERRIPESLVETLRRGLDRVLEEHQDDFQIRAESIEIRNGRIEVHR